MLGSGNNSVVLGDNALGNSAGGSTVTVGNGADAINVTEGGSTINVGDEANGVTLSSNSNTVNVTDPRPASARTSCNSGLGRATLSTRTTPGAR